MDYKYKRLEQELSALSKLFTELGVRLTEVAKEVTAPGLNPSEKLIEQIAASRSSFENVRNAVHGHATAMLVSPLPKLGELVSTATIDSLLKAAAVAEEAKFSIEGERDQALAILGRVLSIIHKDTSDFKPLAGLPCPDRRSAGRCRRSRLAAPASGVRIDRRPQTHRHGPAAFRGKPGGARRRALDGSGDDHHRILRQAAVRRCIPRQAAAGAESKASKPQTQAARPVAAPAPAAKPAEPVAETKPAAPVVEAKACASCDRGKTRVARSRNQACARRRDQARPYCDGGQASRAGGEAGREESGSREARGSCRPGGATCRRHREEAPPAAVAPPAPPVVEKPKPAPAPAPVAAPVAAPAPAAEKKPAASPVPVTPPAERAVSRAGRRVTGSATSASPGSGARSRSPQCQRLRPTYPRHRLRAQRRQPHPRSPAAAPLTATRSIRSAPGHASRPRRSRRPSKPTSNGRSRA